MGLFDTLTKAVNTAIKIKNTVDGFRDQVENLNQTESRDQVKELLILPGMHEVEDFFSGKDRTQFYRASFMVSDSFKEENSHSELSAVCSYAPYGESGEDGNAYPSLYISPEDEISHAVESYKKTGCVNDALEFTELRNNFYFKAKIRYYKKYLCYFYGFDRKGGACDNLGFCMVYPESYRGTENEAKLMKVLDDAAATYKEVLTEE